MSADDKRNIRKCGICGKSRSLVKTECCGRWICDLGFGGKNCYEKHSRFTLCGSHHNEGHAGRWQDCPECRDMFETEMYVYYGTNDFNFEKLENPPKFEPTHCDDCGKIISLTKDGHMRSGGQTFCEDCAASRIYDKT